MPQSYNSPPTTPSSVGPQVRTDFYQKKALIDLKKEQYFSQLADVTAMPKNFGKTIKRYHYLPVLDDRNINDQGINAAGVALDPTLWTGIDAAGNIVGEAYATQAAALTAAGAGGTAIQSSGFLYGSSKDVGTITAKMPALSENGGRVNRVGMRRVTVEGTIAKYGVFEEYTQEAMDFDSDEELEMHMNRELLRAANEMTEDLLQIDLLNSAGTVRYPGAATSMATISGETGAVTEVTYNDLMRLSIDLDQNRTPKSTKIITGSRLVDTKVVESARILYIGSELLPTIKSMTDLFGNQAFIPVSRYADAGNILTGEVGSIDQFRIVVVPEMMHWSSKGASVTNNAGYRATNGNYDVFPMLVVGDGSFTTIGFQTDGKSVKFSIKHSKPGSPESYANDPYGEKGFMSVKWYYGFMALRPERIGLIYTVAKV